MDYTEKDLKKKLKTELVEIAKTMPGYKSKTHNKKDDLIAFILKKEIVVKPAKPTKRSVLLEKASKYVDFRKTVHGASIATLEAFLSTKQGTIAPPVAPKQKEEEQDITKLKYNDLRKRAKDYGWTKRTGTKKELIEFINNRRRSMAEVTVAPEGRLTETVATTAAPEMVVEVREEDIEEWPISAETLKKHGKTVDDLKKLLKAKGIATGLPRTKKEIVDLFKKSRCSFKNFTCSEDEFCDLRNDLCRELNILRNKDKEIKKLAKGLIYIDEEKGRFYGTQEAIAKVREALLHPSPPTIVQQRPTATEEEKKEEEEIIVAPPLAPVIQKQQQQQEEGISPININRLLDKPDENEIRRAILHCLGLYHDIDPNDEIILTST